MSTANSETAHSGIHSNEAVAETADTSRDIERPSYDEFKWDLFPGFQIPNHSKLGRRAWVWSQMYEIEETATEIKYAVCKYCLKSRPQRKGKGYIWKDGSTKRLIEHLAKQHSLTEKGPIQKRSRILEQLSNHGPLEQRVINALITSFNPERFKKLLTRWIVLDNIAFDQVDSPVFREMMLCSNESLERAGCLPTRQTIRDWILKDWKSYKGVIVELLKTAQGKVNISFDLWSSRNILSLCGLVVYFIDVTGKLRQFLLSIPRLVGSHHGTNIAENVAEIICEFDLQDRIGYFVLDNAGNNDTCMQALACTFGFNWKERRIRCAGHVINLVAREILFGKNHDALELELQAAKEEVKELELWRKKGPIGKLHNIVTFIRHSDQRNQLFKEVQRISYIAIENRTNNQQTFDLVTDNDTRWNSTHDMIERAVKLRNAIDTFIRRIRSEWEEALRKARNPSNKMKDKPTILDDTLMSEDWNILSEYLDILAPLKEATARLEGRATQGNLPNSL